MKRMTLWFAVVTVTVLAGCGAAVSPADGSSSDASDSSVGCTLPNGMTCAFGTSCPAGDNCNSCACSANGEIACTQRACVDASSNCVALGGPCVGDGDCCGGFCQFSSGAPGGTCSTMVPPDAEPFIQCGGSQCMPNVSYCERDLSDTGGPDTFRCMPLPSSCTSPTPFCSCLASVPCGSNCVQAGGGLLVTCYGG